MKNIINFIEFIDTVDDRMYHGPYTTVQVWLYQALTGGAFLVHLPAGLGEDLI